MDIIWKLHRIDVFVSLVLLLNPAIFKYLNIFMFFLTFMVLGSSSQQRVEDVVVSFSRILSHHSILQKNQCSTATTDIWLWFTVKNWQITSSAGYLCMTRVKTWTWLPFPVNLKGKESWKQAEAFTNIHIYQAFSLIKVHAVIKRCNTNPSI